MAISVAVPVTDRVADSLIERLVPKIQALKVGPAADRSSDMGPLVTAQHLAKVRGYIDAGEAEGGALRVDFVGHDQTPRPTAPTSAPSFKEPTIVSPLRSEGSLLGWFG